MNSNKTYFKIKNEYKKNEKITMANEILIKIFI